MAKMPAPAQPVSQTMAMPPTMQAIPMPPMPKPSAPVLTEADPEMRGLVSMLRGRQAELPPEMQQQVQAVLLKYGKKSTKDLHVAVSALDKARREYETAVLARNQQHVSWRQFLSDAVQLWQTYATQFADQEKQLQEQVAIHKEALIFAKQELESAKLDAGEVHHVTSDEDLGEDSDVVTASNSATKITQTMQGLATSLQTLHQEAAALVEEDAHVAKRKRTVPPKVEDLEMTEEAKGATEPFGKAG